MGKYLCYVLICVLSICISNISFAIEESEETLEYSYGSVVSIDINNNEIIVSEYDWENDEGIDIKYIIDPNIKLEGVSSLEDITGGSNVDIEYLTKDGKKIAKYIGVYTEEEMFE